MVCNEEEYPGLEALGKRREAELLAAAKVFGLRRVEFLDYLDGKLDQADPAEATTKRATAAFCTKLGPGWLSILQSECG